MVENIERTMSSNEAETEENGERSVKYNELVSKHNKLISEHNERVKDIQALATAANKLIGLCKL